MSDSPKKAVNLWLNTEEHAWVKNSAKARGTSMTEVIRDLIRKQQERERRRPQQY